MTLPLLLSDVNMPLNKKNNLHSLKDVKKSLYDFNRKPITS